MAQAVNLTFLATILALLMTSLIISQTVFSLLDLTSTFTFRQIQSLIGYLAVLIAGVHPGLPRTAWPSAPRLVRTGFLRGLTFVTATCGVYSILGEIEHRHFMAEREQDIRHLSRAAGKLQHPAKLRPDRAWLQPRHSVLATAGCGGRTPDRRLRTASASTPDILLQAVLRMSIGSRSHDGE